MQELQVKIDRLTIIGETKEKLSLREIQQKLGKESSMLDVEKTNLYGFLLKTNSKSDTQETAFYIETTHNNQIRIDFNPSKLDEQSKDKMMMFINMLSNIHLSRIDIAFDIINNPLAIKHRIYRENVSERVIETFKGRSSEIETIYWGARGSDQQIRLYNKKIEQKKRHKEVDSNIKEWVRLELQLRSSKTDDWNNLVSKMLSEFKLANSKNVSKKYKNDLYALEKGFAEWTEFGKDKRRELRKEINKGYDSTLSNQLVSLYNNTQKSLERELQGYLIEYKLVDETA